MDYKQTIRDNLSALTVTYGSMVFEGAIMTMLIALMTPLSQSMNVDLSTISMLITAQGVGTVATIYVGGNMSDKIGRKKIIMMGLISYFIFLVGMFFTTNFYFALFLAVLAGVGHGLMDSPSISMLIDIFGDHSGAAMSMVAVFFSGGGAISTVIVRAVIATGVAVRSIYVVYFVAGILMAIIIMRAQYPERRKKEVVNVDAKLNDTKIERDNKKFLLVTACVLACITFLFSSGNSVVRTWISTYANEVQGLSLEKSVGMLTYLQIGNVLGAFIFAYVLTRVHSTKVMITNGIIAVVSLVMFLTFGDGGVILLMTVGTVLSVSYSLALNIIGELFIENSGQATGFIGTASMSAGMVMTFISGRLLPVLGISKLMWSAVIILIIATVLAIAFRGLFKKAKNTQ